MKASGAFGVPDNETDLLRSPRPRWPPNAAGMQVGSHIDVSDHQPVWHVATGDRRARIAPGIEELGPTLVETVRRRDALPRIAQAVVVAATRNYGGRQSGPRTGVRTPDTAATRAL